MISEDRRAELAMGTTWSSSPWMTSAGTFDRRLGGRGPHAVDDVAGLGEGLARRQPASRGRKGRRADAAEAEAAAREAWAVFSILLRSSVRSVSDHALMPRYDAGKPAIMHCITNCSRTPS